uniref:Uncharacterized protein n=1 Tax=Ditylenchus dipsaci TaxID=166011 RepID=A0A915EH68_9BILA
MFMWKSAGAIIPKRSKIEAKLASTACLSSETPKRISLLQSLPSSSTALPATTSTTTTIAPTAGTTPDTTPDTTPPPTPDTTPPQTPDTTPPQTPGRTPSPAPTSQTTDVKFSSVSTAASSLSTDPSTSSSSLSSAAFSISTAVPTSSLSPSASLQTTKSAEDTSTPVGYTSASVAKGTPVWQYGVLAACVIMTLIAACVIVLIWSGKIMAGGSSTAADPAVADV